MSVDLRPLLCSIALFALIVGPTSNVMAADPQTREGRATIASQLTQWLQADGLAQQIELQKLRWGSRIDNPLARWLKLELRFRAQSTDQAQEDRRFEQLLSQYQGVAGSDLPQTLFYKLAHAAGLPRGDLYVAIAILGRSLEVFLDRSSGQLLVRTADDRVIRRSVPLVLTSLAGKAGANSVVLGGQNPSLELARQVQYVLSQYFERMNRLAGLPAPRLSLSPLEPNYSGIDVEGVRQLVITDKRYWERLQVSIELHQEAGQIRAVCYLDGKYAAGLGTRLPTDDAYADMDPSYRTQLERFVASLLQKLQADLNQEAP
jgi:hypothetical protein